MQELIHYHAERQCTPESHPPSCKVPPLTEKNEFDCQPVPKSDLYVCRHVVSDVER
jgi:hypothetical protein